MSGSVVTLQVKIDSPPDVQQRVAERVRQVLCLQCGEPPLPDGRLRLCNDSDPTHCQYPKEEPSSRWVKLKDL